MAGKGKTTVTFDLQPTDPHRAAALVIAGQMRLPVRHTSVTGFEVLVQDGTEAFRFGERTREFLQAIKRRNA